MCHRDPQTALYCRMSKGEEAGPETPSRTSVISLAQVSDSHPPAGLLTQKSPCLPLLKEVAVLSAEFKRSSGLLPWEEKRDMNRQVVRSASPEDKVLRRKRKLAKLWSLGRKETNKQTNFLFWNIQNFSFIWIKGGGGGGGDTSSSQRQQKRQQKLK